MSKRSVEYIYGINPIFEVIRAGRRSIKGAFLSLSSANNPRIKKLEEYLLRKQIPVEWVEKGRVMDLSGSKDNQGAVIRSSTYPYVPFEEVIAAQQVLLLDNVEDPHNVGAILRTAEIFGFSHVLAPMKGVPDIYPSVVKVSAGATEFLKICKDSSANIYARKAHEAGFTIIALDGAGKTALEDVNISSGDRVMLVIGGEDKSVGQYILNMADYVVRIEQTGQINSLNASVAGSIAMYALGRRLKT